MGTARAQQLSDVEGEAGWLNTYKIIIEILFPPSEGIPLIEDIGKNFVKWFKDLPTVTKSATDINEESKNFIAHLRNITEKDDMHELLRKKLPNSLEMTKDFTFWQDPDLEAFKKKFCDIVQDLNGYPEKVKNEIIRMIKEVFDAEGDTEWDIQQKIVHWYNEVPASVKEYRGLKSNEKTLLKYAQKGDASQFEKIFFEQLPQEIGLNRYTEWGNIENILSDYRTKLVLAKKQIEERPAKEKKEEEKAKLSKQAVNLEKDLRRRIRESKIKSDEVVTILQMLPIESELSKQALRLKEDVRNIIKATKVEQNEKTTILQRLVEEFKK